MFSWFQPESFDPCTMKSIFEDLLEMSNEPRYFLKLYFQTLRHLFVLAR